MFSISDDDQTFNNSNISSYYNTTNSSSILINKIPILNYNNYGIWSVWIKTLLEEKGLIEYIEDDDDDLIPDKDTEKSE